MRPFLHLLALVALMVAPIICSVMREVFSQAPSGEREGAYALGSTKWGMIRTVVLPFGKGGMIGGTMLGLGRALGETMAVTFVIGNFNQLDSLNNLGTINDTYRQNGKNWALFTHNIFHITDKLDFTFGVRYTNDKKKFNATFG